MATMAWETFDNCRKAVALEALGREAVRRRTLEGDAPPKRNAGDRRTFSKRALLGALERLGARW